MQSAEGEEVKFTKGVVIIGQVEDWLSLVEKAMQDTLKKLLQNSLQFVQKSR